MDEREDHYLGSCSRVCGGSWEEGSEKEDFLMVWRQVFEEQREMGVGVNVVENGVERLYCLVWQGQ